MIIPNGGLGKKALTGGIRAWPLAAAALKAKRTTRSCTYPGMMRWPTANGPASACTTEAEWEWAARGGLQNKVYPWGNEPVDQGKPKANTWQGPFPDHNSMKDKFYGLAPVAFPFRPMVTAYMIWPAMFGSGVPIITKTTTTNR